MSKEELREWRLVTPEEFVSFVQTYPNKLEANINYIYEPPRIEFFDFTFETVAKAETLKAYFYKDYLDENKGHYFIKRENK
jgi:hypothetical protein